MSGRERTLATMDTAIALRAHRRVLIDTSVWIYHLEGHATFGPPANRVLEAIEAGNTTAIVSELSLLELLVRPLSLGRQDIADEYELLLTNFPQVELRPVSRKVLLAAATLRARHVSLRTPDSILLATALEAGATAAITQDANWTGKTPLVILPLAH